MSKNLKLGGVGGATAPFSQADRAREEVEQQMRRVQDLEIQLKRQQGLAVSLGQSLADGGSKVWEMMPLIIANR